MAQAIAPAIAAALRASAPQILRWLAGAVALAGVDVLVDWAKGTFTKEAVKSWLKKMGKDAVSGVFDAAIDYVRGNVGIGFVLAAFGKALYADWALKRDKWDLDINVPVPDALPDLVSSIQDVIALLVTADAVGGFDVGSDVAESLFDQVFESMLGDTFKKLWDIYTPTDSLDDDEIRDIISAGAITKAPELALSALLLGLDTWSSMAELLTGFYQGIDVQWRTYMRLLEEEFERAKPGYKIGLIESALREAMGDVIDSAYWYLRALDPVLDAGARAVREYFNLYFEVVAGTMSAQDLKPFEDAVVSYLNALSQAVGSVSLDNPEFYTGASELIASLREALHAQYKLLKDSYLKHIEDTVAEATGEVKKAYELVKQVRTAKPSAKASPEGGYGKSK